MSRRFSDSLDLSQLGPVPYDLRPGPHRYAETQRLIDACLADDERESAKCAAFEAAHGVQAEDPEDRVSLTDTACAVAGLGVCTFGLLGPALLPLPVYAAGLGLLIVTALVAVHVWAGRTR